MMMSERNTALCMYKWKGKEERKKEKREFPQKMEELFVDLRPNEQTDFHKLTN